MMTYHLLLNNKTYFSFSSHLSLSIKRLYSNYNKNRNKRKFIDCVKVKAIGGHGGNGCVSFKRESRKDFGSPTGGNGGRGGCVSFVANNRVKSLASLRYVCKATNGCNGEGNNRHGRHGDDLVVKVPIGTIFKDEGKVIADLSQDKQCFIAARGGEGGIGNMSFATPRAAVPLEHTEGLVGDEVILELEMKTIADIGLVGFPNAGKSTLLNSLSRARPKIASYPFTTLTPQVGVIEGLGIEHHIIVADIPGILPGAHANYGLGHSFLRHIERCHLLVYVLDSTEEGQRTIYQQLNILKQELKLYNESLLTKGSLIVVNKMDLSGTEEKVKEMKDKLQQSDTDNLPIVPVSGLHRWNIDSLKLSLSSLLNRTQ